MTTRHWPSRPYFTSMMRDCEYKQAQIVSLTYIHTHPFNGDLSRTTRVSRYQKGEPSGFY